MKFRRDIPGWLHSNEVDAIKRICSMVKDGRSVIEIGVFAGRTTQIFAQMLPSSDIYCVDPWPTEDLPEAWDGMTDYTGPAFKPEDVLFIFRNEVLRKFNNTHGIVGYFPDILAAHDIKNVGLIHWDTDTVHDKETTIQHFHKAWSMLPTGAVLSGHTFAAWMPNVVDSVRHFAMEVNVDVVLPPSTSIWYMVKN